MNDGRVASASLCIGKLGQRDRRRCETAPILSAPTIAYRPDAKRFRLPALSANTLLAEFDLSGASRSLDVRAKGSQGIDFAAILALAPNDDLQANGRFPESGTLLSLWTGNQ